ncbi:MAG: hypothetical protein ACKOC5_04655 [Chloroflexota bacterium]
MPLITRAFIKASLVFLVLALLSAVLLAVQAARPFSSYVGALGPVYFHLFMVGWVTQLIFGVAIWMFPKYSSSRPRGDERLAWAVFALVNLGLALRTLAEPFNTLQPGGAWGWLLAGSAVLQWLGGLGFVANAWPRVKEK